MKDNGKHRASQLLNFEEDSYLERTSRPIYALMFLLPLIVFYEVGTLLINTDVLNQTQVRVVAFVWLQNFLEYLGFSNKFAWAAPAAAVAIILLALQLVSRKRWTVSFGDVGPMAIECTFLAVPLIVLSLFLNNSNHASVNAGYLTECSSQVSSETGARTYLGGENLLSATDEDNGDSSIKGKSLLANIVTGIGAGIYEELIFRLILISLFMLLFEDCFRFGHKGSIILSVALSAALFSAHHHIIFLNGRLDMVDPFSTPIFVFRTLAGIYFAILFAVRGFAITAGTHAFYDIIATLINTMFFDR